MPGDALRSLNGTTRSRLSLEFPFLQDVCGNYRQARYIAPWSVKATRPRAQGYPSGGGQIARGCCHSWIPDSTEGKPGRVSFPHAKCYDPRCPDFLGGGVAGPLPE